MGRISDSVRRAVQARKEADSEAAKAANIRVREARRREKAEEERVTRYLRNHFDRDIRGGVRVRIIRDFNIFHMLPSSSSTFDDIEHSGVDVDVTEKEVNMDYSGYGSRYETVYTTTITYPVETGRTAEGMWK